jgi:hypothetical protein
MLERRNQPVKPKAAERLPPTQEHLHVRGIVDGVLVSDDGTLASAMEVTPVDLSMMGAARRQMYHMAFSRAIASIRDPLAIQIVIASRPQTCAEYRRRLKTQARETAQAATLETDPDQRQRREAMAGRAMRWAAFVETQLSFVRPLEEQYLIVVWHNPFPIRSKRRILSQERFQSGKQELSRRFALVRDVMQKADLDVRPLNDQELLAVIYRFYHWTLSPLGAGVEPRLRSMQPSLYVSGNNRQPDEEEADA